MTTATLCKAISAHQSEIAIEAIKQVGDVNKPNKSGFTPLQLAAREGLLHVVLHLLNKEASVNHTVAIDHPNPLVKEQANATPHYLAVANGHFLVADILLIAGADIDKDIAFATEIHEDNIAKQLGQLSINYGVLRAMIFWGLVNSPQVLKLALTQLTLNNGNEYFNRALETDMAGFIELACKLNNETAFRELATYQPKCRNDLSIKTAAYWTAVNNNTSLHNEVCLNDDDRATVLYQLFVNKYQEQFFNYHAIYGSHPKLLYLLSQPNNNDTADDPMNYWNTRDFAKWHDASDLKCQSMLIPSLEHKNTDLLNFILINSKIDLYKIVLELAQKQNSDHWITLVQLGWSMQGILSAVGSRGAFITNGLSGYELNSHRSLKFI